MAKLLRYHGLDLPVYGPETRVAWGAAGVEQAAARKGDTFIRRARFRAFGASTLKEALQAAEEGFDYITERCGAETVLQNWGLYRVANNKGQYYNGKRSSTEDGHPKLLPDKHILVAEVNIVRSITGLRNHQKATIEQAIQDYRTSRLDGDIYWGGEAGCFQFANGIAPNDSQPGLKLFDIEPILDTKISY